MSRLISPCFVMALAAFAPVIAVGDGRWVTALTIMIALLCLAILVKDRRVPRLPWVPVALAISLIIWAAMSTLWSISPDTSVSSALKMTGNLVAASVIFSIALTISTEESNRLRKVIALAFPIWLVIITLEIAFDVPASRYFRNLSPNTQGAYWLFSTLTLSCLFYWPWLLALDSSLRRILAPICAVIIISICLVANAHAVMASFVLSLCLAIFAMHHMGCRLFLAGLVLVSSLLSPILAKDVVQPETLGAIQAVPNSFVHRAHIWEYTASKVFDRPWLGHGQNTARSIAGGAERSIDPTRGDMGQQLPLHPHNSALQVWLELGFVGALLWGTLLFWVIFVAGRNRITSHLAPLGLVLNLIILGAISYGAWQTWWILSMVLLTALCSALKPEVTFQRHT